MTAKKALIAGCLLLVLSLAGYLIIDYWKAQLYEGQIRKNMKAYLTDSHQKEFVVGDLILAGNEGFGYNTWTAEAYPVDEPSLKFQVVWEMGEPGKYYDYYLFHKVSNQGKNEINKYLNELYGQEVYVQYTLSVFVKEYQGLDHDEVLTQHGESVRMDLTYYVFVDNLDKNDESERIFKLLKKYVLDNHPNYYFINVNYHPNSYQPEFIEGVTKNEKIYFARYDSKELHSKNKLLNLLHVDQDYTINSPQDLLGEFYY